jgi:crotonobetainyl-CoA:carnitine CoA-transferase CaiB-like acyl-CoA transferase
VLRLAAHSDVMIQNQRPGTLERIGLDARTLRERFPRLVCLSVSGFGARGPSRGRPGFDVVGQAESGMMSITGEPDRMPQKVGSPIIDSATAHMGAQAVLAALFRRERTGTGASIDASLLESAMHLQAATWTDHLVNGTQPMRAGDGQPVLAPAAEPIRTLDGHVVVTAFDPSHWAALCRLIGREDLLKDPRFADNASRVRNRQAMREALQAGLGRLTSDECVALLAGAQIVVGAIRTYAQAQASPDVQASGILVEARAADGSTYRTLGLPYVIDDAPRPEPAAAPTAGADTDAVLAELGYAGEEVAALRGQGAVG